jgi:hypothetical protein
MLHLLQVCISHDVRAFLMHVYILRLRSLKFKKIPA